MAEVIQNLKPVGPVEIGEADTLLACRRCGCRQRVQFKDCIYNQWPVHCRLPMALIERRSDCYDQVSQALAKAISLIESY